MEVSKEEEVDSTGCPVSCNMFIEASDPATSCNAVDQQQQQQQAGLAVACPPRGVSGVASYVVLDSISTDFDMAIMAIKKAKVIGLAMEGIRDGRLGELSWLQISWDEYTFLFDMVVLKGDAFEEGLKDVIEDYKIVKVVHDCRPMSDYLLNRHDVRLSNIFDTQVADFILFRMRNVDSLPMRVTNLTICLMMHLGLPSTLFSTRYMKAVRNETAEMWKRRPASDAVLEAAVFRVCYLAKLRLRMIDLLLKRFTDGCDVYLGLMRDAGDFQIARLETQTHLVPSEFEDLAFFAESSRRRREELRHREIVPQPRNIVCSVPIQSGSCPTFFNGGAKLYDMVMHGVGITPNAALFGVTTSDNEDDLDDVDELHDEDDLDDESLIRDVDYDMLMRGINDTLDDLCQKDIIEDDPPAYDVNSDLSLDVKFDFPVKVADDLTLLESSKRVWESDVDGKMSRRANSVTVGDICHNAQNGATTCNSRFTVMRREATGTHGKLLGSRMEESRVEKSPVESLKDLIRSLGEPVGCVEKLVRSSGEPVVSFERPDGSFEKLVRSLEKPVGILEKPDELFEKLVRSSEKPVGSLVKPSESFQKLVGCSEKSVGILETQDASLEKLVDSLEKLVISLENPDVSLEKPDISLEKLVRSLEKPDVSLERPDVSLEKPDVSLERPDVSLEKPDVSLERPDVSLEKPDVSLERPDVSLEKPDVSLEKPDVSLERPDVSLEKPAIYVSLEKPDIFLEKLFHSPQKLVLSSEKVVDSSEPVEIVEKRDVSLEKLAKSLEKTDVCLEKLVRSSEKPDVPLEEPDISLEKENRCLETPEVHLEKPDILLEKLVRSSEELVGSSEEVIFSSESVACLDEMIGYSEKVVDFFEEPVRCSENEVSENALISGTETNTQISDESVLTPVGQEKFTGLRNLKYIPRGSSSGREQYVPRHPKFRRRRNFRGGTRSEWVDGKHSGDESPDSSVVNCDASCEQLGDYTPAMGQQERLLTEHLSNVGDSCDLVGRDAENAAGGDLNDGENHVGEDVGDGKNAASEVDFDFGESQVDRFILGNCEVSGGDAKTSSTQGLVRSRLPTKFSDDLLEKIMTEVAHVRDVCNRGTGDGIRRVNLAACGRGKALAKAVELLQMRRA